MKILVAAEVLQVEQLLAVLGPEMIADAAVGVVGHLHIIFLADGAHPDVEHAFARGGQIRQALAAG